VEPEHPRVNYWGNGIPLPGEFETVARDASDKGESRGIEKVERSSW